MELMKIDFDTLPWECPMPGIRHKAVSHGIRKVRLVEYAREMEPHWCERGHHGYILSGTMEIEFAGGALVFEAGHGVFIPAGHAHRHRARVLSDLVRAIFVEDA
jgi:hypothetical protein